MSHCLLIKMALIHMYLYVIMRRTVSHFFLVKVALIHVSGVLKKRHASSTDFCLAMSFNLKFSGIQIEPVSHINTQFHWIWLPMRKMVSRKQVDRKTFIFSFTKVANLLLFLTPGKKCCTFFLHEASIMIIQLWLQYSKFFC